MELAWMRPLSSGEWAAGRLTGQRVATAVALALRFDRVALERASRDIEAAAFGREGPAHFVQELVVSLDMLRAISQEAPDGRLDGQ